MKFSRTKNKKSQDENQNCENKHNDQQAEYTSNTIKIVQRETYLDTISNNWAYFGIIFAILFPLVGLIVSSIAYHRSGSLEGRGETLSKVSISISIILMIIDIIILIIIFVSRSAHPITHSSWR
ncbi:hypothetical protein [Mycoplasmopsis bovigenitalium]|uniref:hypothetical protein n=1 Tax=Mycoplasmopsis bovigenitalium TaxID=2112 RepID=UPI000BBACC6F|nr:hypothetical protein [Mycoplasmopsis bovigenitalium]